MATLPLINFGFDELRDRMVRFTVNFDEYIERNRKRILEERNEFAKNIVEDKGKCPLSHLRYIRTEPRKLIELH